METCVLEAALVQVAMHRGLLDMEGRFGALVRDLMKLLSEKQGRKIVICGPPGSGKMTAVEVAAEVCGMELSAVENQFAKAVGSRTVVQTSPVLDSALRTSVKGSSIKPCFMSFTIFTLLFPGFRMIATLLFSPQDPTV